MSLRHQTTSSLCFFLVGRAKRARHEIDQAYDGRRETEERLLAIYLCTKFGVPFLSLTSFNFIPSAIETWFVCLKSIYNLKHHVLAHIGLENKIGIILIKLSL